MFNLNAPCTDPFVTKCKNFGKKVILPSYRYNDQKNTFPIDVHEEAKKWGLLNNHFPISRPTQFFPPGGLRDGFDMRPYHLQHDL